ncbi:hypothetical protein [Kineococcus rhizosphaerae]|uniref:Lipoprotein n=1 Tax=Kineococcus rhizosphaerae TaxID=559628 RepID=A0A2T0QZX5_9ACTN|nr:hypothetical protein [Kineococcus rhizosphaerae]PRY12248.1 hypothetical protein CLV37_111205 [Kineococcus rhizosphaerae]
MSRRLVVAVAALAVLAGCGSPQDVAEREARRDADAKAADLEHAVDLASRDDRFAAEVAALTVPGRDGVELLRTHGEGDGPTWIDVRVTGHADAHSSNGIGDESYPEATVPFCYRFTLRPDGASSDGGSACDGDDATAAAVTPGPVVRLGEDDLDTLRAALAAGTTDLAATFPAGTIVDVAEVDGWTGVGVVGPPPLRDCLLGRRSAGGDVEVWFPPAITVAPGEASCDGTTAATGGARTDPH